MTAIDRSGILNEPKPSRYSWPVVIFHWASAIVILWAMISGLYAAGLNEASPLRASIAGFNVALTTLFVPVFALRIAVRLATSDPSPIDLPRPHQQLVAAAHVALYATVVVVLLTGVMVVDHPANIFGLFTLQPVAVSEPFRNLAFLLHRWSCYALTSLIVLHVVAVIAHGVSGRNVIARMLP